MIARAFAGLLALMALASCSGAPAQDWPTPAPALWRITDDAGHEGWLFGTVHALPEGAEWETPAITAALDQAGVLVVEVADLADAAAASAALAERAHTANLPPLSQRVPAADRAAVLALLGKAGRSDDDFADTETWAAALQLAGSERLGDPALGVDRALLDRGLPVTGLEGFAVQFDLFDRLPSAEQADLLVAVAREGDGGDPSADLRAYLAGDLPVLERSAFAGMMADPGLRAALLDGRNASWVPQVAAILAAGCKPFVAVGAVHMLGEGGLPALLAARGYTVTRIQ